MLSGSTLFVTLTLIFAATAHPFVQVRDAPITLKMAKRFNSTGSAKILERDQARARGLRQLAHAKLSGRSNEDAVPSVPLTDELVIYTVEVGVGSPPTTYSLIVDTGSSNTWVGAGTHYVRTSTSEQTRDGVSVKYGSGEFSGTEYIDTVSLGNGLTIQNQSIGAASRSEGFEGFDGILGIGPVGLTVNTLSPDSNTTIPTVTDNLFSLGIITKNLVAASFEPNSEVITNGELTFGGVDRSKFTGPITYVPVTSTSPASEFWGIDQSIRYGASTPILSTTAGSVDTGTTLTLIASDAFERYQRATGAVQDNDTGLLRLTPAQFANLQSLFFTIGGTTFELTANAQVWPRALNSAIGGKANDVYLIVNDVGSPTGSGLDFINGMTFLERFYSVFDSTANRRVGIATTPFTNATTN